jgi:PelA/Pel-15E family pectate lyase
MSTSPALAASCRFVFVTFAALLFGCSSPLATSAEVSAPRWGTSVLRHSAGWYSSPEARKLADVVLRYQSPQGGWPKSTDLFREPKSPDDIPPPGRGRANSLDNDAFELPVRFLARMTEATGEDRYRRAVERSLDYIFGAQYDNGGFPQFFPLREGYYAHITFNDGAMIDVLSILRDTAEARAPFAFVDEARRLRAANAVAKGIACILRTQIVQDGRLTGWCAQHDPVTLEPAWARAYEPPSLSGGESVGIVRFLMAIEQPSAQVVAAVEGAVTWLQQVEIKGWRVEGTLGADGYTDRRLVADAGAENLWARFYELGTNRPLYLDRDSVFRYRFDEVGLERRSGYSYHGDWAAELLAEEYPRWRERHGLGQRQP